MIELLKDELLKDEKLGLLQLRNRDIIPNPELQMKISEFPEDIISSLLKENLGIVDNWLQKLHSEYIKSGENCNFEDDLSVCLHLGIYIIFERDFETWENGKSIKIMLSKDKAIWINKSLIKNIKIF
jgi:hypothetical protein